MTKEPTIYVGDRMTGVAGVKREHWPVSIATETLGILGVRGSGKSTTGRVIVEGLTRQGVQCVILDPTSAWYGIKSSADGKHPGLPFTILGGPHADLPILPTVKAGTTIAEFVVENDASVVIDLSDMRKGERRQFVLGFLETLYHRMKGTKALFLVVDECDLFVPQRVMGDMAQLVGAMEDIVRRGRIKGIGTALISQRPASINKEVLTQISVLVAHRIVGPQDRKALEAWIEVHGDKEKRDDFLSSLHTQGKGNAWVWSPEWLDMFARIAFDKPKTFDSSATPRAGQRKIVPQEVAKVDLEALSAKMAEIITEAEKSDPKALQGLVRRLEEELRIQGGMNVKREEDKAKLATEIAELKSELRVAHQSLEDLAIDRMLYVVDDTDIVDISNELTEAINKSVSDFIDSIRRAVADTGATMVPRSPEGKGGGSEGQIATVERAGNGTARTSTPNRTHSDPNAGRSERRREILDRTPTSEDAIRHQAEGTTPPLSGSMTNPQRKLLTVLATYGDRNHRQLAMQSGYTNSGGFRNIVSQLKKARWIGGSASSTWITELGLEALGPYEKLPSGRALLAYWLDQVGGSHAKLLIELADVYPNALTPDALAEMTGYTNSGGFRNLISKLRTLGLVDKGSPLCLTKEFGEAIR